MIMSLAQMQSLPMEITSGVGNILYYVNFQRSVRYLDTKGTQKCRTPYVLEWDRLEKAPFDWMRDAYSISAVSGDSMEHIINFWHKAIASGRDTIVVTPTMHRSSFAPIAILASMIPYMANITQGMDTAAFLKKISALGQQIFDL